ncbi:MAG: DNA glycosylase AlkZ-like family protein, partial [Terriglobales bacterium]
MNIPEKQERPLTSATVEDLRVLAMRAALLTSAGSLAGVINELGFIQYDPIRRPARAQDLILHQRVGGYRCGDLDRRYGKLRLEEGFFYIYGAMTPELYRLLHPRRDRRRPDEAYQPSGLAAEVLAAVREQGPTHPRSLEKQFGRTRAVNGWGGFSAATTRALEQLHYHGLLRITYREAGVKVFAPTESPLHGLTEAERRRTLILRLARILAPVREGSLRGALNQLGRYGGVKIEYDSTVADLLASNRLAETTIDGARYLWPTEISSLPPTG